MNSPEEKTQKRRLVDQAFSSNFSAGAVEQMLAIAEFAVFKGKYEFLNVIGAGGMGVVYKARQIMLDRLVAIKMLNAEGFSVQDLRRFQQEAKAASSLIHPNLITIRDFGIADDGQPYMVFDFIAGDTLADMLKKRGQIEIETALDIVIQALKGLSHAHERGVLHRDIKPSNIIISEGNREVKIVDFGIAKVLGEDETQHLTRTGEVFGTPLYMSPEQGVGKKLDARSDLYSMGCVMFEALTAVPPLVGETSIFTIMKHQNEVPPSLKEASLGKNFPASLEQAAAKALAKKPDDRYQTAKELMDALIGIKQSLGQAPTQTTREEITGKKRIKVNPLSALIAGTVVALIVALAMVAKLAMQPTASPGSEHAEQSLVSGKAVATADSGKQSRRGSAESIFGRDNFSASNLKTDPAPPSSSTNSASGPSAVNSAPSAPATSSNTDDNSQSARPAPAINKRVLGLDFSGAVVTPALINEIHSYPNIKELNLSHADVRKLSLNELGPSIVNLNLSYSNVKDEDFAQIDSLSFLVEQLNLDHTHVSDLGMKYLRHQKELKDLSISQTAVTDKGLQNLGDLMWEIRSLNLSDDNISDAGLARLPYFHKLAELDIKHLKGKVTDRGISFLAYCKNLSKIVISDKRLIQPVSKLFGLHQIEIYCQDVTVKDLLPLKEMPYLEGLKIYSDLTLEAEHTLYSLFPKRCHIEEKPFPGTKARPQKSEFDSFPSGLSP